MRLLIFAVSLALLSPLSPILAQRGGGSRGGGGGARMGGGAAGGARSGGGSTFGGNRTGSGGGFRGGPATGNFRGGFSGGFRAPSRIVIGSRFGSRFRGSSVFFGFGGYGGYPYAYGYGYPSYYGSYYSDPYYSYDPYYYDPYYGYSGNYGYVSAPSQPAVTQNYYSSPAPAPRSSSSQPFYTNPDYYLIAFSDHTIRAAISYRVEGGDIVYTTREHVEMRAPLSSVDERFSEQINRDRRVEFKLP